MFGVRRERISGEATGVVVLGSLKVEVLFVDDSKKRGRVPRWDVKGKVERLKILWGTSI